MGIVPVVPQGFTPKSFWQRPEGGAGKALVVLLALGAAGALFYFWGIIVPFVLNTVEDTFYAVLYVIGLLVIADVAFAVTAFGKTVKNLIRNIFQSVARGVARCYTEVDPIGILRNNLDDMKQEKSNLDQAVQRFSGSEEMLQRSIAKKEDEARLDMARSQKAQQMAGAAATILEKQRFQLSSQTDAEKAGMLMQGIKQLKALEGDTHKMLDTFQNWSQVADAKIQRTEFKVNFLAEQRKMILDAKSTLNVGQRILKGKPEQLALVDMALEYLEEDTSRTLGEIREFSRFTDKLLTEDTIENAANADIARQQFAEFSQKLITSGNQPTGADSIQIPGVGVPAGVIKQPNRQATQEDFDPFK